MFDILLSIGIFIGALSIFISAIGIFRLRGLCTDTQMASNILHIVGQGASFGMNIVLICQAMFFNTFLSWGILLLCIVIMPMSSSYTANKLYYNKKP